VRKCDRQNTEKFGTKAADSMNLRILHDNTQIPQFFGIVVMKIIQLDLKN